MTNPLKYTFFWGGPFSQWHFCLFTDRDGVTYNCAEQYMMAKKALLFNDKEAYDAIMATKLPKEQKRLGRLVKGFDAEIWDKHAVKIVYEGNHLKFSQNIKLLEELLKTQGTLLVEASPYDQIWGIGLRADDPRAQDHTQWKGKNWLGHQLTYLRNYFITNYDKVASNLGL